MKLIVLNNNSTKSLQHQGTYVSSTIHVGAKPHRLIGRGAPPGLARYACWICRDARLARVHVAVHFDGVLRTSLVWIHPVFTWNDNQTCIKAMTITDTRHKRSTRPTDIEIILITTSCGR